MEGNDMEELISRQQAIDDVESWVAVDGHERKLQRNVIEWFKNFPSATDINVATKDGTNLASLGTDCISRQSAIDALRDYLLEKRCPDDGTLTCRLIENEVINKLPPIQPKRGKWICTGEPDESWGMMYECSICGNHDYGGNYCSYCGADMRTKETDCDYERAVEQLEHDMLYEPTFIQDDGSM